MQKGGSCRPDRDIYSIFKQSNTTDMRHMLKITRRDSKDQRKWYLIIWAKSLGYSESIISRNIKYCKLRIWSPSAVTELLRRGIDWAFVQDRIPLIWVTYFCDYSSLSLTWVQLSHNIGLVVAFLSDSLYMWVCSFHQCRVLFLFFPDYCF